MSIRWTSGAAEQLTSIVQRIQSERPEAAHKTAEVITEAIGKLSVFPKLGRPGEKTGTRELICPPYVIVYRVIADVAEILFIWSAGLALTVAKPYHLRN